ncbi:hypothetical protein [Actinophytocola sp.]|uniref:hypothetical protein n=1 Tax=Actinophytocola sp. TaxID=1872138 RepID=UPI002D7EF40D|nr:hypothetical protein [Actinophytocola sp.]HET9138991.1 hypothetical protein [Actinophytocola sp.]
MTDPPGPVAEPPAGALSADERAELERLRGEIAEIRQQRQHGRHRFKSIVATVLIVLGCLLAPVALTTVWVHNQVSDTDRFVATMSPLIDDPSVQTAITDRVVLTVFSYVDVRGIANEAVDALQDQGVPAVVTDRLRGLIGPMVAAVENFIRTKVSELVSSPQFAEAWRSTIRVAHDQAEKVLSGEASAISIQGEDIQLDLAPFIEVAKQQLRDAGLTLVDRLPDVHPTISITGARELVRARNAYAALDSLANWLPWVTLALLALGIYLARNHRRALMITGLGFALSMVFLAANLAVVRSVLINSVPARSAAPTAAAYDIVVRFLREGLRSLVVLGLVIALGAFLTGPSVTAVRIRAAGRRSATWLRERGLRAGLRTGRVGGWVHRNRTLLRGAALGVAVLIFIFLDRPNGFAVLMIALVLVALLAVIQLLDQPASPDTS